MSRTCNFDGVPEFLIAVVTVWAGSNEWTSLGPKGGSVGALAIDPLNSKIMYVGTSGGGLFKSIDAGMNWTPANTGVQGANVLALVINPKFPSTIFAGTGSGVFKSIDAGKSWNLIRSGLENPDIDALAIDPRIPTTVYAGTWGDGVYKTVDAGLRWTPANGGLSGAYVYSLAIDPQNPSTLYAGTNSGLFISSDAGKSWTAVKSDLASATVQALAIDPHNSTTIIAGSNTWVPGKDYAGKVWKSTDGGKTWKGDGFRTPEKRLPRPGDGPSRCTYDLRCHRGWGLQEHRRGATWSAAKLGTDHNECFFPGGRSAKSRQGVRRDCRGRSI